MGAEVTTVLANDDVVVPARADTRPRPRRMLAFVAATVASVAVLGYLRLVDPNQPGHYPLCPVKALFHVDCPGCGCLRGLHALTHGDIAGMAGHNLLLVAAVPATVVLWARWGLRSWSGQVPGVTWATHRRNNRILVGVMIAILVFGLVRNFVPALRSGA